MRAAAGPWNLVEAARAAGPWATALLPNAVNGAAAPSTAQFAVAQARHLARNPLATVKRLTRRRGPPFDGTVALSAAGALHPGWWGIRPTAALPGPSIALRAAAGAMVLPVLTFHR